jgi:hypothetical protein
LRLEAETASQIRPANDLSRLGGRLSPRSSAAWWSRYDMEQWKVKALCWLRDGSIVRRPVR